MADPVRVVNRMRVNAPATEVLEALRALKGAIEAEGLDRALSRPDATQPSVRDLELVAWELVIGPEGLPGLVSPLLGT